MKNRVCEVLNIKKPVIQGPMAWISTAPLVAAVSNAGGLGVLGVGFAPLEFAIEQIKKTKELTDKPFAINVDLSAKTLDNVTEMVRLEKPPVVYADTLENFKAEVLEKYFPIWHREGCKIVTKVGRLSDAIASEKAGADVIIAKGWEGGGHTSFETTMVLTPLVKEHVAVPVVAGGGIATGRGAAAEKLKEIAASSLKMAMVNGETEEHGAIMVGQIVPLVNRIRTTEEIIDEILEEANKIVDEMHGFAWE